MRALILKGKYKNTICEVSQWCNDWFMLNSETVDIARKPFSPSSLGFTVEDYQEIKKHKNNGTLFSEFEAITKTYKEMPMPFMITFKRRK